MISKLCLYILISFCMFSSWQGFFLFTGIRESVDQTRVIMVAFVSQLICSHLTVCVPTALVVPYVTTVSQTNTNTHHAMMLFIHTVWWNYELSSMDCHSHGYINMCLIVLKQYGIFNKWCWYTNIYRIDQLWLISSLSGIIFVNPFLS